MNVDVAVFPFPSVTVKVTPYSPATNGVQSNEEAFPGAPHPDGSPDHPYVYVPAPEPPLAPDVEIVVAWPTSTGFGVAEAVPALSRGFTVRVNETFAQLPFASVAFAHTS